ncbi:regulator of chromosome condensation repeat-containing protein, partial [Cystoisospora suis]
MISMKRFIPFRKHRHSEEEKPVAEEELTAILSTDALIKEVPYRDTRTLVFIYGKPLISSSLTQGGLSGDAHANLNFPLPGGGGAGVATGNGDPLNFYTSPPPLPLAAAYGAASPPVGGGIGSSPAGNSNSHSLAIGGGGANFGANVSPSIGNPSPPLLLSATGGTETAYVQPVILTSLAYIRVVSVCVGETHALFLSDGGEVYSYGEGVYGQLGLGWELQVARQPVKVGDTGPFLKATIHQIACGDYHSVALTTEGAVYCWGAADCVGDGSGFCRYTPVWIRLSLALSSHLHSIPPSSCLAFCRTVAARFQQTMAVTAGGHLLVWGETFFATFHPTPEVLCVFPRAPHYQVIQIAIGKHFGLALTEDGHVYGWGDGTYGELTTASAVNPLTLPRLLNLKDSSGQSLPPVTAIAAGTRHAILRTQDMRLWSFGDNLAGQCGVPGHQTRLSIPKMIKLGELRSRASKVACGFRHSACIT